MGKIENENIEIELFSSIDEYEVLQVSAILEENKIPFLKKQSGSGSYMSLYMGQSAQEKTLYINKNDYKKALELISPFINETTNNESNLESEIDKQEEDFEDKYKKIRRWMGMLILGIPILVILIIIIVSMIIK